MSFRIFKFKILRSAIVYTFIGNFLTSILASLSLLVIAYFLSPSEIADVRLMQAFIVIGMTVAGLGFTTGLLKFCSEIDDADLSRRYLGKVLAITAAASLGYILIVAFGIFYDWVFKSESIFKYLLIFVLLSVPLSVAIENCRNYLYSKREFERISILQVKTRCMAFVITVGASYLWGVNGFVIGSVVSYGVTFSCFIRALNYKITVGKFIKFPASFLSFSLFAMLGNLFVILSNYGDMLILDSLVPERPVLGAYALASAMLAGLMVVTASVQTVLLPDMLDSRNGISWLRMHFIRMQLKLTAASLLLAAMSALGVYVVFPFIYGDNYYLTPYLFFGLCLNYVLVSSGTLGGSVLMGLGKTSINTFVAGGALMVGFVFTFLLVEKFGVWGAVYGKIVYSLVFCVLSNFFAMIYLHRKKEVL